MMRPGRFAALMVWTAVLASSVSCAHGRRRDQFFGRVVAACAKAEDCDALRADLAKLDACETVDAKCDAGERVLRKIFGDSYRPKLPDFVVWFDQREAKGSFRAHDPVLLWNGESTPHLYGARDVYAVVLTEHQVCLEARVTTNYRTEPNPMAAVLAALGSKAEPATPKASERTVGQFQWYPLSGNPQDAKLWVAIARAAVDVNSTSRITVQYVQPKQAAPPSDDKAKPAEPDECTIPAKKDEKGAAAPAAPLPRYTGDFLAANGFFSNSPGSWVTLSLALGATFHVRGTSVESGGSTQSYNGYAMAKLYAIRPRLTAGPRHDRFLPSLAAVVGTGVKSPFDEIVFGLSAGHLVGSVGVVAGANSIAGAKDSTSGRKVRPFAGIEYSF